MTEPTEHPLLCKDWEVRAFLDGTKTQFRRAMRPQPDDSFEEELNLWAWSPRKGVSVGKIGALLIGPFGVPGDLLSVREAWAGDDLCGFLYRADHPDADIASGDLDDGEQQIRRWSPSTNMSHWVSRLNLKIVDVRVEHVQDITPEDAIKEGVVEWSTKENERRMFDRNGKRREKPLGSNVLDGSERRLPYLVNGFAELWESQNAKRVYPWESNPYVWCVTTQRIDTKAEAA